MSSHLNPPILPDSMDSTSDLMSDLSEATSPNDYVDEENPREANAACYSDSLSDLNFSEDYGEQGSSKISPSFGRGPSYSPISDDDDDIEQKNADILSPLESLPTELLQDIATRVNTDSDLGSLIQTSPSIYSILHPEKRNCIWRQRFLARYDYPHLESTLEFPFAYKVRQFVLQGFDAIALGFGMRGRSGHQLDVVKDMILETYNKAKLHEPVPKYSKNLAVLSARNTPTWVTQLMSCSFYGGERRKYGQSNLLFDTLQVTLSHLVLSPDSSVLAKIPSSRDNYDLAKVYNYNKPLATILQALEEDREEVLQPFKNSRFPNLRSPSTTPPPEEPQYRLDMHTLLHIRNFWQRHFAEEKHGIGENTYSAMVRSLAASGITPREWDRPLQEWTPFETSWYGHYSCTHPWPKDRQDLEERQSCAEDWKAVDPMTLELETSTTNDKEMFWPAVFASIPAFAETMPDPAFSKKHNVTYLRGIAPFVDLRSPVSFTGDSKSEFPKWHSYLASRVNGFVHDIPSETLVDEDAQERRNDAYDDDSDHPIPGWKHIVMIIWKPTTRSLLAVLDHAEEEYGGASGTQISADFNTANIWNNGDADSTNVSAPSADTYQGTVTSSTNGNHSAANVNTNANANTTNLPTQPLTDAQIEVQLKLLLTRRINSFTKKYTALTTSQSNQNLSPPPHRPSNGPPTSSPNSKPDATPLPPLFSPTHIRHLEESFSQAQYLGWDDGTIDYAYAYEGVIIPGGKIMMGRWWRIHGIEGLGAGREVGPDAVGVEVKPVQAGDQAGSGDENGDADTEDCGGKKKGKGKGKGKGKAKATKAAKHRRDMRNRRSKRRGKKRKANVLDADSDEEFVDREDEVEYEFVTVVNGEESRAVNGCKGLERGPFVFWTG